MNKIYLTSDFHFGHQQEFLYKPRGFDSPEEMNEVIIKNFNEVIDDEDDVYFLGDLMLNDNDAGMAAAARLKGRWHLILGNHDTVNRQKLYATLPNVVEICYATVFKYKKLNFYLSHFPTLTGNDMDGLHRNVLNFYGHTHQSSPYSYLSPYMYNVGVDAHDCKPVLIDDAIEDMRAHYCELKECYDSYQEGMTK